MKGVGIAAVCTTIAIPILPVVAQVPGAKEAINTLGLGNAQVILAFITVVETVLFIKGFLMWRTDMQHMNKTLTKLVVDNSIVLSDTKDSNKELQTVVRDLSKTIEHCKKD